MSEYKEIDNAIKILKIMDATGLFEEPANEMEEMFNDAIRTAITALKAHRKNMVYKAKMLKELQEFESDTFPKAVIQEIIDGITQGEK